MIYIIRLIFTSSLLFLTGGCIHPQPREFQNHRSSSVFESAHSAVVIDSNSIPLESKKITEPSGELNLAQAVSLALLHNPRLKAFDWEIREKEALALQANLLPNPELGMELENVVGSGSFQAFDGIEATLQLGQLIELGGKRARRYHAAELEKELAGWDYETAKLDVLNEIAQTFVDVISSQDRVEIVKELYRISRHVAATISERVQSGKDSPLEQTRAEVVLASTRLELERAVRELESDRKRLALMWGNTTPNFTTAAGRLDVDSSIPDFDGLLSRIEQNPDWLRWITETEHRQAVFEREKAKRISDVVISGGVRYFGETDDGALVASVSLPLPIFDRNQGAVRAAQAALNKAEDERREKEIQIRTALAVCYQQLATSYDELQTIATEILPGAQSAFDAAQEGYRQGKFSYLQVLDTQRSLFEYKIRSIDAFQSYHKSKMDLERLIGGKIDDSLTSPESNAMETES
jgi:cobalt-zinc-cadmium efflux system outer membrane protein